MDRRTVRKILVLELWNIGDVVLTLPFLQQLRTLFPDARITMVGRAHARALLAPSDCIDEFIEVDLNWQRKTLEKPFSYPWPLMWRLARRLRREKFDIAFQNRPHVREYVMLFASGAKRRVGVRKTPWDMLLTDRVTVDAFTEQKKESWLRLLAPFGGPTASSRPTLKPMETARQWATEWLASRGVSTETVLVGVHPGASVASKRWPLDRFEEILDRLSERPNVKSMVFVDPDGYGSSLPDDDRRLLVRQDLPKLVALLEQCDLLVCNDSGPMHIAAALGVPCVAVYSSGIDRMFEPLGTGHHLITPAASPSVAGARQPPPPYDVTQVPVARVLDAIETLIG